MSAEDGAPIPKRGSEKVFCLPDGAAEERAASRSPSPSPSQSPPWHQRHLLHKPLEELTEEDIMQLTREDCRRYLKEKGMRRPSWNKSQAIQQVLSLKGLFDSKDDYEKSLRPSCGHKKLPKESSSKPTSFAQRAERAEIMPEHPLLTMDVVGGSTEELYHTPAMVLEKIINSESLSLNASVPSTAEEFPRRLQSTVQTMDKAIEVSVLRYEKSSIPPCPSCSQHVQTSGYCRMPRQPSAQLTIFYSGMVNVFDNVPADKAQAIMLLAASRDSLKHAACLHCHDPSSNFVTSCGTATTCSSPTSYMSYNPNPVAPSLSQGLRAMHSEHSNSREASLQRYLEKRRGRYRIRAP